MKEALLSIYEIEKGTIISLDKVANISPLTNDLPGSQQFAVCLIGKKYELTLSENEYLPFKQAFKTYKYFCERTGRV